MAIVLMFELILWFVIHLNVRRRYEPIVCGTVKYRRLNRWLPAFLFMLDKLRLWQIAPGWTIRLHHTYSALHGERSSLTETKRSMARMAAAAYGAIVGFTILGVMADGKWEVIVFGLLSAAAAPFLQLRLLNDQIRRRRRSMLLELPEVVTQVLLLMSAGETLHQALSTIVERNAGSDKPFLHELELAVGALRLNASLTKALDGLQKRCGLQEVTVFVSTLLLHYKRGGDDLVIALRTLSKELWEKRKALSRTLGEEASSKLVFPMVLVFIIVLIVIASPAVMMMNANS